MMGSDYNTGCIIPYNVWKSNTIIYCIDGSVVIGTLSTGPLDNSSTRKLVHGGLVHRTLVHQEVGP